jgi:hypothetical protein
MSGFPKGKEIWGLGLFVVVVVVAWNYLKGRVPALSTLP